MFENYPQYEYPLAQVQLVLFMLGMGATLSWKDFAPVLKHPRDLILGLLCVLVVSPLIALGLAFVTEVSAGIAMGLLLVGALPGGSLSNVLTFLGRGNVALSIALSTFAALLALFTIPLTLQLLAGEYVPADFEMPVLGIVREILLCVLLPLAVGMYIARAASKERATLFAKWSIRVGFLLVVLMVIASLGSGRMKPGQYGFGIPLVIIAFCLLLQQLCLLPFRLRGWPPRDFVAIGLEVTIRNVYLGILLAALLFPAKGSASSSMGGDVLFVVLFYGAASLIIGCPLALRIRRKIGRMEREAQTDHS